MRETALAHLLGDGLRAAVGALAADHAQIPAVAVLSPVSRRDHLERPLIEQLLQLRGCFLAQPRLRGAFRMLRFRSVDSDDPHPSLPELQRVAVNDAGEAADATAAAEAGRDAFRLTGEET